MGKKGLNIYHRRDGRWEGRYKDGFHENGKPRYRSVYAHSYAQIKEKLISVQARKEKLASICNLKVETIYIEWLNFKRIKVKDSTVANYQFKADKYLMPAFGHIKINELSPSKVYQFIRSMLNEGLSAKYVSDIVMILKSLAKYAATTYHCSNPIADVELPQAQKYETELYSKEQQRVLRSFLLTNMSLTKLGVALCLFTGIRIGELCALQWSDIDFDELTIHISKTCQRIRIGNGQTKVSISSPKSQSSNRIIPIPCILAEKLRVFAPSSKGAFVLSGCGKVIEPRTMQYRFQKILHQAGLPATKFHNLRHLFATSCIECGFDVKTLSEILGHGTVEITLNRYVHSSMNRKRECMERLSACMV